MADPRKRDGSIRFADARRWAATVIGYGLWTRLLTHHPANRVAPFSLGVPVVGMAAGLLVLGETVTPWQWTGVACVLAALVCVVLGPRLQARFAASSRT